MKTKYKWIRFEEIPNPGKKTTTWECKNTSDEFLGDIAWETGWRQYVFTPDFRALIFNHQCLKDIGDFLEQLNFNQKTRNEQNKLNNS